MLLNSLYTLHSPLKEEERFEATIYFSPQHTIFEGHFPGNPVVPGVCMIQIVKETMEALQNEKLLLHKGHQLKFLRLIVPEAEQPIVLLMDWKADQGGYRTQAQLRSGQDILFKFNGSFQALKSV